jgi:hypothetical protein
MKKLTVSSITAVALFAPVLTMAAPNLPAAAAPSGTGVDPLISILGTIGNWMFGILLAVAAVYILMAAFSFLMAKGDEKAVKAARSELTYALVAVVVGALTKGLIAVAQAIAQGAGI